MSKITVKKKTENFTILDNTGLRDKELSWKAKGLLAYLLHLPDDWQIYIEDLKNRSTDGKTAVSSGIKELIEKGYVKRFRIHENGKFKRYDYEIYETPQKIEKQKTVIQKSENLSTEKQKTENQSLLNINSTKELNKVNTNKHIYSEVINYLNDKTSKNFKSTTKKTKDLIKARINEGFTIEEFKKVIDIKCAKWLSDKEMNVYLRPETLFGNKFEGYLNECLEPVEKIKNNSKKDNTLDLLKQRGII